MLLNKKYALPHRVVDALVGHFLTFATVSRELPVLWHQSLLVFAQRYKHDITVDQKNRMKHLLKSKFHYQITPEIRRELFQGHSRGENELQFTHMSVEWNKTIILANMIRWECLLCSDYQFAANVVNAEFLERNRGEKSWLLLFYPFSSKVLAMLKSFTNEKSATWN